MAYKAGLAAERDRQLARQRALAGTAAGPETAGGGAEEAGAGATAAAEEKDARLRARSRDEAAVALRRFLTEALPVVRGPMHVLVCSPRVEWRFSSVEVDLMKIFFGGVAERGYDPAARAAPKKE